MTQTLATSGNGQPLETPQFAGWNPAARTSLRLQRRAERRLPRRSAQHEGGLKLSFSVALQASARQATIPRNFFLPPEFEDMNRETNIL
jgi:hypothetical protein